MNIQEFAWITIHEARVSTKLGKNVMLLTYVSIFYLPLGFCAVCYVYCCLRLTSMRRTSCINTMLAGTLGNPKYNRHKHKNAIHIDSNNCLFFLL